MERKVRLSPSLEERLLRLSGLADGDSTGLVSGLHSFIEEYVRETFPELGEIEGFADVLRGFTRRLGLHRREELRTIGLLIQEHEVRERLRTFGGSLDQEEALAARHNFLSFCAICRIE
jgi:hypothetical protein